VNGVVRGDVYEEAVPLRLYERKQLPYLAPTSGHPYRVAGRVLGVVLNTYFVDFR